MLKQRRQTEINRNNARENKNRVEHEYKPGDKLMLRNEGTLRKLSAPREGTFKVLKVNNNGTLRIQRGAIEETVNIRRCTPYLERSK